MPSRSRIARSPSSVCAHPCSSPRAPRVPRLPTRRRSLRYAAALTGEAGPWPTDTRRRRGDCIGSPWRWWRRCSGWAPGSPHSSRRTQAFKQLLYDIHESTGVAIFALVLLRLLHRVASPPAPLPSRVPRAMRFAAHANHALLYAMLLVQPVLGFLDTNAWGFPLTWAGLVRLPSPIGHNETIAPLLSALHWYGAAAAAGADRRPSARRGVSRADPARRRGAADAVGRP